MKSNTARIGNAIVDFVIFKYSVIKGKSMR